MQLSLTTWQRLMCVQALNAQTGHISLVRKALKLLEILELSEEEAAAVGLSQAADGNYSWQDVAHRFELEVKDRELSAHLRRAVDAYQGWPVGHGREALELAEQLGSQENIEQVSD